MPTREQLESALRNADKAGDYDAAKQLANALKAQGQPSQETVKPTAAPKPDSKSGSTDRNWYDPVRSVLQGATFGFADEIGAGIAAGPASIATGKPYGEVYKEMHSGLADERADYRKNHGGEAMALEVAGALPVGLASGAKALGMKSAQAVPRWMATAGVGATEGAVYGAGTADRGERGVGALKGGAVGGVAAPAVGAVAGLAGKTLSPVIRSFKEHMTYTPKSQSMEVLRKVADDAGLEVDDIVSQYKKLGKDGMLTDVDENFRGLMRALSDRSGTAKRNARNMIEGRQMGSVDRLISKVEKTTGNKADEFVDTVSALKKSRGEKAAPFYDDAWGAQPSETMINLAKTRPSLKPALKKALKIAGDEGEDITENSFKQFHYAKMAIDDRIGKATRAGKRSEAKVLIDLKNELLDAMDTASPSYAKARDLYAGDSQLLDAANNGMSLFKLGADDIDDMVAKMSNSEKELFRHGAVKSIVDKLEDSQLTHDNAKKLVNSKTMQRKLSKLFDSPDDLRDFVSQAIREREFTRTRQVVAGGSPTSQNTQMQKQLDDYAAQAFSFLDGTKGGVVSAVMSALKGKPITPQTIDEAARVLLDNGLTERQIREIFTRSRIIEGAQMMAPGVGNAARGATVPVGAAINQE